MPTLQVRWPPGATAPPRIPLALPLTRSVKWSKSVRNLSEIVQSPAELLIILRIFAHVMSRCDLDLWSLDLELLQNFGCHMCKLCTKFERNRIIDGWVFSEVENFCPTVLRGPWAQLLQTWGMAEAQGDYSYTRNKFFQRSDQWYPIKQYVCNSMVQILLHFHTRAAQSWVMLSGRDLCQSLTYDQTGIHAWWPSTQARSQDFTSGVTEAARVQFFSKKLTTTFFSRRPQNLSSGEPIKCFW